MSDTVIRVENLSKKYIIGHQRQERYVALRDVVTNGAKSLGSKLLGSKRRSPNPTQEEFWALNDVSFDVKQGDRVGIIGRNGAGKSTLLKILSRITEPTRGRISIQGRVASLLEVGTGFHPELTGRENVYLNGAILGMSKTEIRRKFDEIVAFAEVERFLDTPVKRYSSGMYVRLAFAVAAHLEPEILIVDEVLAVGDVQFQKKCLGKMGEVAREGRTVLFVSHSMQAISQFTNRCVLLRKGGVELDGTTEQAVIAYLTRDKANLEEPGYYRAKPRKQKNYLAEAQIYTSEENGIQIWGESITFEFSLSITEPKKSFCFAFQVVDHQQNNVCHFLICDSQTPFGREQGTTTLKFKVPKLRLYMGSYTLTTWFVERKSNRLIENLDNICHFEITMNGIHRPEYEWKADDCVYLEDGEWSVAPVFGKTLV